MKKLLIGLTLLGATLSATAQTPTEMKNCVLKQHPQTRVVEVSYELTGNMPVYVTLDITTNGVPIPVPESVWGDITTKKFPNIITPDNTTPKKIYWVAKQDWPDNLTTEARATVTAWFISDPPADMFPYLVVDLSDGPAAVSYPVRHASILPESYGPAPAHKTTELWLKRIPAGTFSMGSPSNEYGRNPARETQHQVTLTKEFYIGVFQVTQKQYELVTGTNPSQMNPGYLRPVEEVSYDMIRGGNLGAQWPASNQVDANSFMGRLQARTTLNFDLPTEAQWKYACRAGTLTSLNSGENITDQNPCPNLSVLARYWNNGGNNGGFSAEVGSFLPNAWGLYDMHGNVNEWCLDWFVANLGTGAMSDPTGPGPGTTRVLRGGCWGHAPRDCRSASRDDRTPDSPDASCGFRACIQPTAP